MNYQLPDMRSAFDFDFRLYLSVDDFFCVLTHPPPLCNLLSLLLEPDSLECKAKWALQSITTNKASGGDGIPVDLLQILKDDAMKVLHSACEKIWKTHQWSQDWKKITFHSSPKERQC